MENKNKTNKIEKENEIKMKLGVWAKTRGPNIK